MAKISKSALAWRRKQKPQSIMTTAKFKNIERKAEAGGATSGKKVAGAAYWNTVRAKYLKSKLRKGKK